MGMKTLVTGAAGFLGSHLVDYLIEQGHDVYGLDDLSGGSVENINKKCLPDKFYKIDLRNYKKTEKAVFAIKPDVIFHLAADATEGRSQFTPINCAERNYIAALNILSAGIKSGIKRFVFTSSMAVYGNQKPPFDETMQPRPEDIYGISKAAAEKTIEVLAKVHGLEYVIVRPHNVYGPRQNMRDPYRNVIAIFMNKLLKKEPFYIYGEGEQLRAFSYIDDVTSILGKCGFFKKAKGEIFNVGSDTPVSINKLARQLIEISGVKIEPIYLPRRPQEVIEAYCSQEKAKRILGYKDKTSLRTGVRKMWEWAQKRGPQKPIYIEMELENKNTPETWLRHLI